MRGSVSKRKIKAKLRWWKHLYKTQERELDRLRLAAFLVVESVAPRQQCPKSTASANVLAFALRSNLHVIVDAMSDYRMKAANEKEEP